MSLPAPMSDAELTLQAYEHWAPSYCASPHNPLMRCEQQSMLRHLPPVDGRRVLDLACGTGRYASLVAPRAASVVALDFCSAMLERVIAGSRVRGDMTRLPFRHDAFDVVICGLAIGHAQDIRTWVSEVARVLARGGAMLYSDFHPAAARAGLTRSFRDVSNRKWVVPHCGHDLPIQERALAAAGLHVEAVDEIRVGLELTEAFPQCAEFYDRWHGLPLVLVVRARK